MQDVAVTAWEKRSQLQDASKMAPWLYRITIRHVQMFWRKTLRDRNRREPNARLDALQASEDSGADHVRWIHLFITPTRQLTIAPVGRL